MSRGGFPEYSVNVLTGDAGSGKSLFSRHFATEAVKKNEVAVYISVDEAEESVFRAARQYDLGLEEAIQEGNLVLHDYQSLHENLGQDLIDFDDLTRMIDRLVAPTNASRLIVDSVAGLGLAEDSPNDIRRGLLRFIRRIRENDVTALFVTEMWGDQLTRYNVEEYVGDSLTVLRLQQQENKLNRSINIRKMRFTDHDTSFRPVEIGSSGMMIHNQGQVFGGEFGIE